MKPQDKPQAERQGDLAMKSRLDCWNGTGGPIGARGPGGPGRPGGFDGLRRLVRLHRTLALCWLTALALFTSLLPGTARAACSAGGCVSAGPRLASVDSSRGALLNALLGSLTNSTLNVTVADWNTLASADLSLLRTVGALQATLNTSTPAETLATDATVLQVLDAAITGATAEGRTQLAIALGSLRLPLSGLSTPFKLGSLLQSNGVLGTTRVNALELVTGVIQLYNARNVLATPQAITLSGNSLGLGSLLTGVTLQAQVVEPPVIVCGGVGSTFHSSAIRVKLGIDLVSVNLDVSLLTALLGGGVSASIGHLDLYVEVARTDGAITAINAVSNAVTVQATPGVAALYLGRIDDALYFNRSRAINPATDLGFGVIGTLKVGALNIDIKAKAAAVGSAISPSTVTLTPASPSATVYANAGFTASLVSSLVGSLQLDLGPGLLSALVQPVLNLLKPPLQLVLQGLLGNLVTVLVDPLLNLLGLRLGETVIGTQGVTLSCAVAGRVYADANHNAAFDGGETGTGLTLYAKLLPAAQPGLPALAVATVDPATGGFSFPSVAAAGYVVVVNGTPSATDLTPAAPTGWIPTEAPTLSRSFTLTAADVPSQRFGLFNGSRVSGIVFKDNGIGGGLANNGVRDGGETPLAGGLLSIVDAGGAILDRAVSGDAGAYTVWIPASAAGAVKLVQTGADAGWVVVSGTAGNTGGAFLLAEGAVGFTPTAGTSYSAVNFGDVPANALQPDGQQTVIAGAPATYAHTFTAGTGGTVAFTAAAAGPAQPGWGAVVLLDQNCNGLTDAADTPVAPTITVAADQKVCVLVKVATPEGAADGTRWAATLTAHFVYANSPLTRDAQRGDVTTIGPATAAGLRLVKTVDRSAATSGDLITYTITYTNLSSEALASLVITDATPAYTVFQSAACGSPPNAQLSCAIAAQPAAGAAGRVEWRFAGTLGSGLTGTVVFVVKLQ